MAAEYSLARISLPDSVRRLSGGGGGGGGGEVKIIQWSDICQNDSFKNFGFLLIHFPDLIV
jgi:hypothetical protein